MDYFMYEIFYTNFTVTPKHKIRTEMQMINKGKTEKIIIENHQTELADQNI